MSTYRTEIEGTEIIYNLDQKVPYSVSGAKAVQKINAFADSLLGLVERVLHNIKEAGFEKPTDIQSYGIPQVAAKLDMMCCSHTGSGKTATYLIPIINLVAKAKTERAEKNTTTEHCSYPAVLILAPTRELAEQIARDAITLSRGLLINVLAVFGGDSISKELGALKYKHVDMVVATPGRILHLLQEFTVLSLASTMYLVIDEADEMLSRGFFHEIGLIIGNHMSEKENRITSMFSATFPRVIQGYARKYLRNDHVNVVVGIIGGAAPHIRQKIIILSLAEKRSELLKIIEDELSPETSTKILVFCNKIETVVKLEDFLTMKKLQPCAIHSDLEQTDRDYALSLFNTGRKRIMVATSVASRGINISGSVLVVNFDIPQDISDYIQRIGRARAWPGSNVPGSSRRAEAISFFDQDVDEEIVPQLCMALKSANQPVPKYLKKVMKDRKQFESHADVAMADVDTKNKIKKFKLPRILEFEGPEPDAW